uniref:adenylyl-sulfate kinase n=1 Tax=Cellvibrio fontiphilus TaxID=1815559 RepID=UPI002B4BFB08|nr:adenylyl-sulfate kinase [Cellvibrio fontiphilus]
MQQSADQFQVHLTWLSEQPLMAGRSYRMQVADQQCLIKVTQIKYKLDLLNGNHLSAKFISANEAAVVNVSSNLHLHLENETPVVQLFDISDDQLLAHGRVDFALYRATNIRWQNLTINKQARALAKQQQPCCIWFTGLSGAGKSTIANLLEKKLYDVGCHTYLLDGDNLRHGLNRDLGFTEADRIENIRRVAEVAKLMVDSGLIVIASFISPFKADRQLARALFEDKEFIEVFVDTPLIECERRDVKGLYAKARRGELKNFTGIDSGYEPPENPELCVQTTMQTPEQCVEQIVQYLITQNILLQKLVE